MDQIRMRRSVAFLLACCSAVWAALGAPAPAGASDDTYFNEQWSLSQIHASEAWASTTGSGITIGIVDTGVDATHPELRNKVDATANCVGGTCREGGAQDAHGHGTVIAGIAAASTGNGRGMAGVAPDARLVVAKAVDDEGRGSVEDINAAIRWAVDRGARVVNLSLGDPNFLVTSLLGTPLRPGIDYAWSRGAVPVIASGNENVGLLELGSANYGALNAVVVGATERSGGVASYSSPIGNAKWGLVAPGGSGGGAGQDILSTYLGGRYAWVAGTSMAAPHVAGAIALLLAKGLSPTAAVERMLATVDRSVKCGGGCQGRLDLGPAVAGLGSNSGATPAVAAVTAPATTTPGPRQGAGATTTTLPRSPTTTAVPPTTAVPGAEMAAPAPVPVPIGAIRLEYSDDAGKNPAVVAVAVGLTLAVWSAAGAVSWLRFRRADERW